MDTIKYEVELAENEESSPKRRNAQEERHLQALRWDIEVTHIEENQRGEAENFSQTSSYFEESERNRQAHLALERSIGDQAIANLNPGCRLQREPHCYSKLRHKRPGLWFCTLTSSNIGSKAAIFSL